MNYQKILDKKLARIETLAKPPRLLLHSCCAPCSSYVLEYLSDYFEITVFYYNPNISPQDEYEKRVKEQETFISKLNSKYPITFREGKYDPERFYSIAKGLENEPEGGLRCFACYALRLEESAKLAAKEKFDYFTTTLSISPLKNAEKLNTIGEKCGEKYGVAYLQSDFKKKNGYLRSIELSKEYNLYRQNYCGCIFSQERLSEN
ncbi:MAG: epoxyqueuosine reductase QueH [Lachnospiraceae bacterium]|nr:epoxyqueuosine reductase QueH [Lachnospiraceae bacterium]MDD3615041.1 epoxyqueuosine reductase QueH [Lachnospiraceae bacterium]